MHSHSEEIHAVKEYIKAMRLPACIFAGLTTLVSFKLAHNLSACVWPAISTVVIFIATMVQNDLRDRFNDRKKRKVFAYEHPTEFRRFTILIWLVVFLSCFPLAMKNPLYLLIAVPSALIGLAYSELEKVPYLPNGLVAIAMGLAAAYPILDGFRGIFLWIFIVIMVIAMYFREILKDYEDRDIDQGYKWTLWQGHGESRALGIAVMMLILIDRIMEILTLPVLFLHKEIFFRSAERLFISELSPEIIGEIKIRFDIGLVLILLIFAGL